MEVETVVREPSELVPNSPSLAIQLHCVDPAEVTAVTNYWNWQLDRLEPGEFHGSVTLLQLGHLLVTKVTVNRAALHRLACPANGWRECSGRVARRSGPLQGLHKFCEACFKVVSRIGWPRHSPRPARCRALVAEIPLTGAAN